MAKLPAFAKAFVVAVATKFWLNECAYDARFVPT